jgi:O-antigen ligase
MLSLGSGGKPRPVESVVPHSPPPALTPTPVVRGGFQQPMARMASAVGNFTWRTDSFDLDPIRRMGFLFALAFLFARFSYMAEAVANIAHVQIYMNYWTGGPAILLLLLSGGLRRGLSYKAAVLVVVFAFFMAASIPTSHWPGGSFGRVKGYLMYEIPILFLVGGLAANWDDVKKIFAALAWSGIVVLGMTRLLGRVDQGRLSLDFDGSIANPNDLASQLLLVIPFFLFIVIDKNRSFVIRIAFLGAIGYAFYLILGTASRGALVAIAFGVLFALMYASMGQRLAVVVAVPLLAAGAVVFLPERTLTRLGTLTGEEDKEANESKASRRYLFEQSLLFTMRYPLTGVGADQFANFEGSMRVSEGLRGNWHATHCSWTQVSSECGIPALLAYAGAIFLTFKRVRQSFRVTRRMKWTEGNNACFCFLLSMVLFFVSITFLSNAYTYRQPAMVAIGFIMSVAVDRIVSERKEQGYALA